MSFGFESCAPFFAIRTRLLCPRALDERVAAAEKWCVPARTTPRRGRAATSSSHRHGGRPSVPMSRYGKSLWPEAARQVRTLEPAFWSRWIVRGDVGRATGARRILWQLVCVHALRAAVPPAGAASGARGRAQCRLQTIIQHISPRSVCSSPRRNHFGERGLPDYIRKWQG